jgi:hypothetical protein
MFLAAFTARPAQAHIGSPDVFFEGDAGPYHLFVTIRAPAVIPGVAAIEIRNLTQEVREIRVVPMRLTGPGSEYPPSPDLAERSKEDAQFFTASLWLMERGSLQVRIEAEGDLGTGHPPHEPRSGRTAFRVDAPSSRWGGEHCREHSP